MNKGITEGLNKQLRISEGIGKLKIINAIQARFKNADGSFQISSKDWAEFVKPYTELPK